MDFLLFQLSILVGQIRMGVYAINALLRKKKEVVSSLSYFAAHVFAEHYSFASDMGSIFYTGISGMVADKPGHFSLVLFLSLLVSQASSLFKNPEYVPRLLMVAFYINCVYTALTVIGLIVVL